MSAPIRDWFHKAHTFYAYVATGTPDQLASWMRFDEHSRGVSPMSDPQRTLLRSFTRRMPVLVLSGMWCGDCVHQCPLLEQLAECNREAIDLRFIDRDVAAELSDRYLICGGRRVPTVLFLNEDFEFVSLLGDRSLTRYRAMAAKQLGAACPLPGAPVPADEIAATRQDWLHEFERAQLILRLSPKLRQRHGD
jgi:thiol-disulfide isomerase/thioredoxin